MSALVRGIPFALSPRIARGEGGRRPGEGRSSVRIAATLAPHPALRANPDKIRDRFLFPLYGENETFISSVGRISEA